MRRIKEKLDALLSGMGEFTNNADKVIDYNKVKAAADDLDESLIASLWGRGVILRQAFFKEIGGAVIFNAKSFKIFLDENKVNNSYTDFANRIGLADAYNHIIDRGEVVLNFPYKDCVLEGGQT
ncbi:MAG: site-specific DNA-methyltransferase, partial [Alphaproteobacteria bacterium]|nr:site-specific DNA-methyltransferase [Alphaproteobacteria bacterium]